jgi:hypothetical protein
MSKVKKKSKVTVQANDNIYKALSKIQQELKVPRNQFNKFGNFYYRSCEDILEAVKPLLNGFFLIMNDKLILIGERYYIKATAKISNGKESIMSVAYARESLDKKGMDDSQITGTASSYARKYALNGLFAIDDTKDSDTQKDGGKKVAENLVTGKELKALAGILQNINNAKTAEELEKIGIKIKTDTKAKKYKANQLKVLRQAYDNKKKKLALPSK